MLDINVEIQPIVAASMEKMYDRYIAVMTASGKVTTMNFNDFWNQMTVRGQIAYNEKRTVLEAELNITEGVPK